MIDFRALCGLTVESALKVLKGAGIQPEVVMTESPRRPAPGTARVLRVSEDGRVLTAARFPDAVAGEGAP